MKIFALMRTLIRLTLSVQIPKATTMVVRSLLSWSVFFGLFSHPCHDGRSVRPFTGRRAHRARPRAFVVAHVIPRFSKTANWRKWDGTGCHRLCRCPKNGNAMPLDTVERISHRSLEAPSRCPVDIASLISCPSIRLSLTPCVHPARGDRSVRRKFMFHGFISGL